MTTKNNNTTVTTTFTTSLFVSLLILIVTSNMFGFLAWVSYQIAAKNSEMIPSISLITGLAFWNLWTIIIGVPVVFKVMFQTSFETQNKLKEATQLAKVYEEISKTYTYTAPKNYVDNKKDKLDS